MPKFTAPLEYEATGKTGKNSGLPTYRLVKGFMFEVGPGFTVEIPAGTSTDLASLPWPIRNWFKPSDSRWAQAAVVHDYCCSNRLFSRSLCAHLFMEGMLTLGCPAAMAWLLYVGVKCRDVYLKIRLGRNYYLS